ncbi:MAG: hypothetical protein U1E26_01085 [Coriobacteriia bacterium]|nr:hypothetical protein [Coriobacteriia bacterium]
MADTNDTKAIAERLSALGAKPLAKPSTDAKELKADKGEEPSKKSKGKKSKGKKSDKASKKAAKSDKKGKDAKSDKAGKKAEKISASVPLPEAGYPNLVLCVVDAVFVQRGRLTATGPVCSLTAYGASKSWRPTAYAAKFTTTDLVAGLKGVTDAKLASDVFGSDTKALGCPDLTRARVVVDLCRGLAEAGVLTKADARDPEKRDAIAAVVKATRGIAAAGEARLMQSVAEFDAAGAPWLADYFSEVLGRQVAAEETDMLLDAAIVRLVKTTPGLTARDAAFVIWRTAAGYSPTFRCL